MATPGKNALPDKTIRPPEKCCRRGESQPAAVGSGVPVEQAGACADIDQLRGIIAKSGKKAAILIERGDSRIFVPVDLG